MYTSPSELSSTNPRGFTNIKTDPNQIRALKEQLPELTGSQIRWRIHSSGDFEDPSTAHTEWTKDEIDMMQWCIDNNREFWSGPPHLKFRLLNEY